MQDSAELDMQDSAELHMQDSVELHMQDKQLHIEYYFMIHTLLDIACSH